MANKKRRPGRRIWRTLLLSITVIVAFLLLFVVAFVWNPLEGSLPELRDAVPRGVNFFARKQRLADDFTEFPEPKFWAGLTDTRGFDELMKGSLAQNAKRAGVERALQQAREAFERVRTDTQGWIDVMRDVIGKEVIVAGYEQDYTKTPPQPLAEPWWCCWTRVSWRVRAAHGVLGFGLVQDQLRGNGVDVTEDGELFVVKSPGAPVLYVKRHLDVLMIANHKLLLEQSQRLIDGNRDEEPIGQMAAYTDGAVERIERWARNSDVETPNVLEFVVEPNAYDAFRRFAAGWPNPQNKDSMNERVLASFLNLKGWEQLTGGLIFADNALVATGQVGLNSKRHTSFQSSFYQTEQSRREEWLDPFLAMVPASSCAAAGLRMPVGDFLHAMFEALDQSEKDLLNDALKRIVYQGAQLTDTRDLIEKLRPAFLSRTGFVFRRNTPDVDRDEKTGELKVPVTALSPMPQVAWVFWLRQGAAKQLEDLLNTLRASFQTLGFRGVWNLRVKHRDTTFPEPVSEFANPQIPATGAIAMIVFSDFFVVSNSGPFVREILLTRYSGQTGARSIRDVPEFKEIEGELLNELNGLVWIHGDNLLPVLDDYRNFADAASQAPDPDWMLRARPAAEDQVRRQTFPQYPSKASMPKELTDPNGDFDRAVVQFLQEKWRRERTNFTADDRAKMEQLRAMAQLMKSACIQVELHKDYIRYLARVTTRGN